MESIIHFVHTPTIDSLEQLALDKTDHLTRKYNWLMRADVFFKEDKGSDGKGKICEIRLNGPKTLLFASSNESSFEISLAETISDLEIQLKKRKEEFKEH